MAGTCNVCGEEHPGRLGCPRFDSVRPGRPDMEERAEKVVAAFLAVFILVVLGVGAYRNCDAQLDPVVAPMGVE